MARSRIFIAAEIDDAVRQRVAALQRTLAASASDVKWVEPQNLHVTVLFLGEVEDRELHTLSRLVTKACAKHTAFDLRLGGVGAFPTPRRPKTLWAGVTDGAEELQALHAAIQQPLLDFAGYRPEVRAYTPHLTLGRVTADENTEQLAAEIPRQMSWTAGQCEVTELVVFASGLRKSGPEYTVVSRAPLAMAD